MFYTGFTRNLKRRMEDHAKGLVVATRDRRPLRVIYYEACIDETDAPAVASRTAVKRRAPSYWKIHLRRCRDYMKGDRDDFGIL